MIQLTREETNNVLGVIVKYHNLETDHKKYSEELEKIQIELKRIGEEFQKTKQYEDSLMSELHKKYGKFDLKELLDEVIKQRENGNE